MIVCAIDPGTEVSGWAIYSDERVIDAGVCDNGDLLERLRGGKAVLGVDVLAIEMVASYGMAVGAEVFRTVWWTGRFAQVWLDATGHLAMEVVRKEVKLHLCMNPRAKDSNVRIALIDRLGPKGTKKNPGPTFGVSSHAWQALAVAVTTHDNLTKPHV